ncbi:MAG: hypothetical protein JW822_06990 [Spirochaetales bacterium]|nr:hypothetical protein [Spirochaetales bacterium]
MKFRLIVFFFFTITLTICPEDKVDKATALLKKYSSESYFIVSTYNALPEEFIIGNSRITIGKGSGSTFLTGSDIRSLLSCVSTFVHEIYHAFSGYYHWSQPDKIPAGHKPGDRYYSYYLGNGEVLIVKITRGFYTVEIAPHIPEELRFSDYGMYINTTAKMLASQQYGVFGLLEEWNAYYWSTKCALDLLGYYEDEAGSDSGLWISFFNEVYSTLYIFQEFKYFIIKYLEYARKVHPDIYQSLINNNDFKEAYHRIHENHIAVGAQFEKEKNRVFKKLRKKGLEIIELETYTTINNTGFYHFMNRYRAFEKELKKPQFAAVFADLEK